MHLAEEFYASGTFWLTAVLVILTIVLLVFAWLALPPKKWLTFGIRTSTPMLRGPAGAMADIEVRRRSDEYVLAQPYHVEVVLENRGRSPIVEADFSNQSVRFHLGAPIKIRYEVRSQPPNLAPPDLKIMLDDDVVELEPGLFAKAQSVIIPLVVEGRPKITYEPHRLNAKIVEGPVLERRALRTLLIFFGIIFTGYISIGTAGILMRNKFMIRALAEYAEFGGSKP